MPVQETIDALRLIRSHAEFRAGHAHLYGEFDGILQLLEKIRRNSGVLDEELAREILATVALLLTENSVGRRPWSEKWETYFRKCMEDANRLLKAFSAFTNCSSFCHSGYCNRFLSSFAEMDRHVREYEASYPVWSRHFASLALLAAEMFSLVADREARIIEEYLDHPEDRVFTCLLTGYAKSKAPKAGELLANYANDEEAWVRRLARTLLAQYFETEPGDLSSSAK